MTKLPETLSLPPLSLYVHIPWCVKKCPYCDFNSHSIHSRPLLDTALLSSRSDSASSATDTIPEEQYIDQLLADLKADALYAQGRKLQSIFFGGGTPSLFSAKGIARIIDGADKLIGIKRSAEITLEANPGTTEHSRFTGYHDAGVNRLSIGAQSMQDRHLETLGRIHSSKEVVAAVNAARGAGFDNFNIDLMHGLPDQSIEDALNDLQQVIDLSPAHLSWYQLTIEQNTAFYRQPPKLPVDDVLAIIEEQGHAWLQSQGFSQYEVSAFCLTSNAKDPSQNLRSQHNLNYWMFGDYLGIGAGAHGKITDIESNQILRRQKTRLPAHYLSADFSESLTSNAIIARSTHPTQWNAVDHNALPLEFMMNALRLNQGVPSHLFHERTGLSKEVITSELKYLIKRGLLENDPFLYKTTDLGRRFLNEAVSIFMEE
ncbi:MAG: radical SAM family heme chaperone HemW [Cellvibrionaceae bacterium]